MNIKCQRCHDSFDVPDGKGITRAVCPFCDNPNDLRQASNPDSFGKYPAPASYPHHPAPVSLKAKSHPLAPPLWILAICAMILTIHTLIGSLINAINRYEAAKAMEAFDKTMKDAGLDPQQLEEESKKAWKAATDSMDALRKDFDKLLQSFPQSYQP